MTKTEKFTNTLTNDNLFILNGLNSQSVDLIYLDPPFNSKRTYSAPVGSKAAGTSFKDMWTWNDVDKFYLEKLIDDYPNLVDFIKSIGDIHSKAMMSYITYMTQRLIEMHRVLKDTGSLYLHCDPTASHYLKIALDSIFNKDNFNNEIVWKRKSGSGSTSIIGTSHDIVFRYSKNLGKDKYHTQYLAYSEDYIKKIYNKLSEDGRRYRLHDVVANPALGGTSPHYTYKGFTPKTRWLMKKEELEKLDKLGKLEFSKSSGRPYRRMYLDEMKGAPITDMWTDIKIASGKEATGYPTQKPLALLHRIVKASSNEGDVVLDPFCGCATTCVAAQQLGRKWIGIDIEKKAANILIERLADDAGIFRDFVHRTDVPKRTDIKEEPITLSIKERLFASQAGLCMGCKEPMEIWHLEVDHKIPKSKGGGDYYENYQLLCGNCNRIKGNRPMEFLNLKIEQRTKALAKISFGE